MTSKIVYIEDDPVAQKLVKRILSNNGYEVHIAGDGLQGLDMVKQVRPDLLLVDINLPTLRGTEIATHVRGQGIDIPIIALSASGLHRQALAAGCTGYIQKPIEAGILLRDVQAAIQGQKQEELDEKEIHLELKLYSNDLVARMAQQAQMLREYNKQLERANERLEELDRMKTKLLVTMGHELRTPMTLVKGYANILSMNPQNVDPKLFQGLENGIDRMHATVNRMLMVLSLVSGEFSIAPLEFDLSKLVGNVLDIYKDIDRLVEICFEAPALPAMVWADEKNIFLVLDELLSNAIKYTPDGGQVTISIKRETSRVIVMVSDTGIGIPQNKLTEIFQPFTMIEHDEMTHSTSRTQFKGGGMGLGLTIAQGIIELHQGKLMVRSKPGRGTTFAFNLSLAHSV